MTEFFINRPIVAIVLSIMIVVVGILAMLRLPIELFPNIIPPEVRVEAIYTGADSETLEKSVANPIEQQMSGVDYMNYMYSMNSSSGMMRLTINFDINSNPDIDQILAQLRQGQAQSQLPEDVRNYGVTVRKGLANPFMVLALHSPNGSRDAIFLANYANISLVDRLLRVRGISQAYIFGPGQYALRIWVRPDRLSKLGITVPEITNAIKKQNTVNPGGKIGGEPAPPGQQFTYTVRTEGRLVSEEEFASIVVRANTDGSFVRLKDVARIELGAQDYNMRGRLNGKPAVLIVLYQTPGTNALEAAQGVKRVMEEASARFPSDLEHVVAVDTTRSISEGIKQIVITLLEAVLLVILVVFIFLQGWRATLIPTLAIPVSLIGTFAFFPLLGFTINTLSLFGLVLAIGLVVDNAIIVVESVERHMEEGGLSPKEATIKTMGEVSGPILAITMILMVVFVPTIFIPGITGRLYQQFAVTIAISVFLSTVNALTLSPALSALLLKPRREAGGFLGKIYRRFNVLFAKTTYRYIEIGLYLIKRSVLSMAFIGATIVLVALLGKTLPVGFVSEEDQGYFFMSVSLPGASSLERTDEACRQIEAILSDTPGIQYSCPTAGFSIMETTPSASSAIFFVALKDWDERKKAEERIDAILASINRRLAELPHAIAFAFPPPAIPGIGLAGGVTFILEDREGKDVAFLGENTRTFIEAARKRPELARVTTSFQAGVPQMLMKVDRDKALKRGRRHRPGLPDDAGLHGRDVCQLLQPLRPAVAGLHPGRSRLSLRCREHRAVFRPQQQGRACSPFLAGQHSAHVRPRDDHALQPVPVRPDRRDGKTRLQFRPGHEGPRGGVLRHHAPGNGLRLPGHELPGEKGPGGRSRMGDLPVLPVLCLPDPGCAVRELVASAQRSPHDTHRRSGGACRHLDARPDQQRLCPDRPDRPHRSDGEERHPDRRIRKAGTGTRNAPRGGRRGRRPAQVAAHSDDVVCLHHGRCAAGPVNRRRRPGQADHGDGRRGRDDGRFGDCRAPDPGGILRGQ